MDAEMNRVVITGLGWVTPMGHSIDAVWKRLLNGESGIAKTTVFDAGTFPTTFSAEVKNYDLHTDVADTSQHETAGRNTRFALGACAQAWKMSGLNSSDRRSDGNPPPRRCRCHDRRRRALDDSPVRRHRLQPPDGPFDVQ